MIEELDTQLRLEVRMSQGSHVQEPFSSKMGI